MTSSFEMGRAHNVRFMRGGGGGAPSVPEPSPIADLCALHGHAPHYTLTLQDTNPRPVTCGCGAVTYPEGEAP